MKVALAQIDSHPGSLDKNLAKHLEWTGRAIEQGCDLIVFPELSISGDKQGTDIPDVGLDRDDALLADLADLSSDIDIVVGLVERGRRNLYNRYNSAFYYTEGRLLHRHRKLFLVNYAVFEEGKHYVPGNNLQAFDTRLGRASILICNDAWHASAPYIAALDGAELLIIPSASARGTLAEYLDIPAAWGHMNRAYSSMMGFYTVFANRVGVRADGDGKYQYWGGSELIGPRGEPVASAPQDEETMIVGEVDRDRVAQQRFKAPLLRDARLWIIRQEINRLAADRTEEIGSRVDPTVLGIDTDEPIL